MQGLIGFGAGGLVMAGLTLLLSLSWRGNRAGAFLILACAVTAGWCGILAYESHTIAVGQRVIFVAELLRHASWILFLLSLLQLAASERTVHWAGLALLLVVAAIGIGVLGESGERFLPGANQVPKAVGIVFLLLVLVAVALLEQLYRNAQPEHRGAMKYLVVGLGLLLFVDLYLYSYALLFRRIEPGVFAARGFITVAMAPAIAVAASRSDSWSTNIFVSRQFTFYSVSLLLAGFYLIAMALGGYYLREIGGEWGALWQTVFVIGGSALFALAIFSQQVRAAVRVFLTKHFYRNKYDYRVEWLQLIDTLAAADAKAPLPNRCLQALCRITGSPGGGLWVNRDGRYTPLAGSLARESGNHAVSSSEPFIRFMVDTGWVIDTSELLQKPARYAGLDLPSWMSDDARIRLVVPLFTGTELFGFMILFEPEVPIRLNFEDHDLLKTAGRQAAGYLAWDEVARELTESRQLQAYNQLTAFIMHDLKNLIAQQSLVVRNAVDHADNPEFVQDAIDTIDNSVQRMRALLVKLKQQQLDHARETVALHEAVTDAVGRLDGRQPEPTLRLADDVPPVLVDRQQLTAVIEHVVRNAQEAISGDGHIVVSLTQRDNEAAIVIEDDGCGMTTEFISERLFRPFDSTKGTRGMGIGAYQAREFARAEGGRVEVDSRPGEGTRFKIVLPLGNRAADDDGVTA